MVHKGQAVTAKGGDDDARLAALGYRRAVVLALHFSVALPTPMVGSLAVRLRGAELRIG